MVILASFKVNCFCLLFTLTVTYVLNVLFACVFPVQILVDSDKVMFNVIAFSGF